MDNEKAKEAYAWAVKAVENQPEIPTHEIETTEDDTKSGTESEPFKLTPEQTKIVESLRKNPKRALRMIKRRKYYQEDNHETAILNAMNSGLGRRLRRNLARKMMVDWQTYLAYEDIVVENHLDDLKPHALRAYMARKAQQLAVKKISLREYKIASAIVDEGLSYEQADELLG